MYNGLIGPGKTEHVGPMTSVIHNQSISKAQKRIERFLLMFEGQVDPKDGFGEFVFKRQIIMSKLRSHSDYRLPRPMFEYFRELLDLNRDNRELMRRYDNDIHSVGFNIDVLEEEVHYTNMVNLLKVSGESYEYLSSEHEKISKDLIKSCRILNTPSFFCRHGKTTMMRLRRTKHRIWSIFQKS